MSTSTSGSPGSSWRGPDADDPADRLDRPWRQGQRPDLRAFLAQAGALTPAQRVAVVLVDQARRWWTGERIPAEAYLCGDAALDIPDDRALDVVYGEFFLREQMGEEPDLGEYGRRFPHLAEALRIQIELHHALERHSVPPLLSTMPPSSFRTSSPGGGGDALPGRRRCRPWRVMKSWPSWAGAPWGSSTRPGTSASNGSSP